jgi:integrase
MERRPDLWSIQRQLDDLASWCISIYIDSEYGRIRPKDFKAKLDQKSGRAEEEVETRTEFLEFLDQMLDGMKDQGIRRSSYYPYLVHVNLIKGFAEEEGEFTYEDVDWNLRLRLIDWLSAKEVKISYGNKCLSMLRQFLERARRKGLHQNTQYQGTGWLVPQKKAVGQKVILTPKELKYLAEMPLTGFLKKVRDLFLIGAGTGQRYSDYSRYKPHHFYESAKGTPILSLIAQKTDIPAIVPLNIFPWLIPILEEYGYHSPKLSMQKMNDGLKVLCQKAGFEDKVLVVEQLMGRKAIVQKSYLPKYEKVTSHTCRRSFATNLYRMGYSIGQIMPMTGHSTEGHLRTYIGIDAEENAENIASDIRRRRLNED